MDVKDERVDFGFFTPRSCRGGCEGLYFTFLVFSECFGEENWRRRIAILNRNL